MSADLKGAGETLEDRPYRLARGLGTPSCHIEIDFSVCLSVAENMLCRRLRLLRSPGTCVSRIEISQARLPGVPAGGEGCDSDVTVSECGGRGSIAQPLHGAAQTEKHQ